MGSNSSRRKRGSNPGSSALEADALTTRPTRRWTWAKGNSSVLLGVSFIGTALANTAICCLLAGCLTSQQQASVSQGRIYSDNFTCCHTETEVADQTFYLTQSQYTDAGPTCPSADPITKGACQGSHWSANFLSHWYDSTPKKKSRRKRDSNPGPSALEADALTTRPARRYTAKTSLSLFFPASSNSMPSAVPLVSLLIWQGCVSVPCNPLAGLVVKASASGAEDPGFKFRLRPEFSVWSHTSELKIGTPVATLPGPRCYRVSAGTGQPGVSIL